MNELTTSQKQFIDDNFYEGLDECELDKQKFDLLATPYELQYLVDQHNWDDGIMLMQWVAESNICSVATALQLFWFIQPEDFQSYKLTEELKGNYQEYENAVFSLLKTIYRNFQNNFYLKTDIHFDPADHILKERRIPDFMKKVTNGEEPYVYYEEKEVNSWFGEYLQNRIAQCATAIELYNIAYFIKYDRDNRAELILKHPLCDKGIALMIFWRLKTYSSLWFSTNTILDEIIRKIQHNEYQEVLMYDPAKDPDIKMKDPKPKWTIPESMKQKV